MLTLDLQKIFRKHISAILCSAVFFNAVITPVYAQGDVAIAAPSAPVPENPPSTPRAAPEAAADPLKGFVVSEDFEPLRADMLTLEGYLRANPGALHEILNDGMIRVIVSQKNKKNKEYMEQLETRLQGMLERLIQTTGEGQNFDASKISREYITVDDRLGTDDSLSHNFLETVKANKDPGIAQKVTKKLRSIQESLIKGGASVKGFWERLLQNPVKTLAHDVAAPSGRAIYWLTVNGVYEMFYLPTTFFRSMKMPNSAVEAGIDYSSKIPGAVMHTMGNASAFANVDSPVGKGFHLALGLGLQLYHSVFITWWMEFQDRIGKERGMAYQTAVNFAYGQLWGFVFFLNAWASGLPDAKLAGFGMATALALAGSWTAAVRFQGLGRFVKTGAWQSKHAKWYQLWVSDMMFTIGGVFGSVGKYGLAMATGLIDMALNLGVGKASQFARQRPTLLIADEDLVNSVSFQRAYPFLKPSQCVDGFTPK